MGRVHLSKKYWTVAVTKFDEERSALKNLRSQEFVAYLPRYRDRVKNGVRHVRVLFPGYIFVHLHRDDDWTPIRSTRGIRSLMYANGAPARVLSADIARIRAMEVDEFVVLPENEPPSFSVGDTVIAFAGMCAGHMGSFVGRGSSPSRGQVMFEMMRREVKLEVSLFDLA